ncbi:vinorine synthase-like [Prunus yedoensis var. nudiflora]|uniref:Vinorine synthase-like n=1 Tax=Prunus yedoensis var. nudiflora TaxID=2094558 RepID=A0A314UZW5_PRUYE|nr:vinorine synthase-like [Prunus yedoensis var. nudiflora]
MVIGLCLSHKVADASAICTFIHCWATTALQSSTDSDQVILLPEFGASSLFPPLDFSNSSQPPAKEAVKEKCTTGRKLGWKSCGIFHIIVPKPTRVEAASALIWKCKIEASARSSSNMLGTSLIRPSVFSHTVNIRKKTVPPLPENLVGNLVDYSTTNYSHSGENTTVIDLKGLVAKIRGGLEETKERYAAEVVFDSNEAGQKMKCYKNQIKKDDIDKYYCSSWCRFPFYEADFGWGKPSWVSSVAIAMNNATALMDTRDGNGIEAWVTLSQENMALFESNKELLAYASLNPRVTN